METEVGASRGDSPVDRNTRSTLTAVFEPCAEGGFHAYIKEIPGVHSEGETLEEARLNLMDALTTLFSYRIEKLLEHTDLSKSSRFEAELVA